VAAPTQGVKPRPIAQNGTSAYLKIMAKPLLYAFGGLPVALLAVLLTLGHQPPAIEEPQTTETLTPATPLTPDTDAGPASIPSQIKAPPERATTARDTTQADVLKQILPPKPPPKVLTEDVITKIPPETIAAPRPQVDGSDETAELAPAPVRPRDDPEMKIAAEPPPAPPPGEQLDGTEDIIQKAPPETIAPRPQVDSSDETAELAPAPVRPRDAPEMKIATAEPRPAVPPLAAAPPIFGNERQIAAADPAAKAVKKAGRVIVQPGNTLWRLSRVIYGKGRDYVTIAEANRDIVRDPSLIFPGQVIAIPGATPPEKIDPKRKRPLPPTDGSLSLAQ
jgi:nucleoid-associated protein YgaU